MLLVEVGHVEVRLAAVVQFISTVGTRDGFVEADGWLFWSGRDGCLGVRLGVLRVLDADVGATPPATFWALGVEEAREGADLRVEADAGL